MMPSTLFYGDPHGDWRPLLQACAAERPDGVVLIGDCELAQPLRQQLRPLFDTGIRVRWIPGNHDTDSLEWHDNLWGDYPEGNLHGRYGQVGDMLVAGLGGVFKERVWYPRYTEAVPVYATRRDARRMLRPNERWRGGLPLGMRDAIFPEDVAALGSFRADVLVSHEAPSSHKLGFHGIDVAAAACRAKLVVHGHHHQSYAAVTPGGLHVRGLAKAEVFRLQMGDLP